MRRKGRNCPKIAPRRVRGTLPGGAMDSMRQQKPATADQHWWRHRRAHGCQTWQDADADGVRYRRCRKAGVLTYFEWRGEAAGWHRAEGPRRVRRSSAAKPKATNPRHDRLAAAPLPRPHPGRLYRLGGGSWRLGVDSVDG
jgi:hypothetical protein